MTGAKGNKQSSPQSVQIGSELMLLQPWPGLGLCFIFCFCRAQGSARYVSLGPWEIFSVMHLALGMFFVVQIPSYMPQSFKAFFHPPSFSSAPFLPGLSAHLLPLCPLTLAPDGLGDSRSLNVFDCLFLENGFSPRWVKPRDILAPRP